MSKFTEIIEIIPDNLPDWAYEAMEEGQLFITLLDRIDEQQAEIEDLKGIINKAKVDPNADQSCDPLVDNSYTGQIAQLKAEIAALREWMVKASHHNYCMRLDIYDERDHGCNCGLDDLLKDK